MTSRLSRLLRHFVLVLTCFVLTGPVSAEVQPSVDEIACVKGANDGLLARAKPEHKAPALNDAALWPNSQDEAQSAAPTLAQPPGQRLFLRQRALLL
jgi:hypothetical protein